MLSAPGRSLNQLPTRTRKKMVATSGKMEAARFPATLSAKLANVSPNASTKLLMKPLGGAS